MVLSGEEIRSRLGADVCITPYQEDCINPNSYNLSLHNELLVYEEVVLDAKQPNRFRRISIPDEGMILSPGQIYLGRTIEYTETHNLVPMIEGRSSIARLGLFVHCASGFVMSVSAVTGRSKCLRFSLFGSMQVFVFVRFFIMS